MNLNAQSAYFHEANITGEVAVPDLQVQVESATNTQHHKQVRAQLQEDEDEDGLGRQQGAPGSCRGPNGGKEEQHQPGPQSLCACTPAVDRIRHFQISSVQSQAPACRWTLMHCLNQEDGTSMCSGHSPGKVCVEIHVQRYRDALNRKPPGAQGT